MDGNFDIEMIHKIDKELAELLYKAYNKTAVELSRLCFEYNKTPEEVLEVFKKLRDGILD